MNESKIRILFDLPATRSHYIIQKGFLDALKSLSSVSLDVVDSTTSKDRTVELLNSGPDLIYSYTRRLDRWPAASLPEKTALVLWAEPTREIPFCLDAGVLPERSFDLMEKLAGRTVLLASEVEEDILREFYEGYAEKWGFSIVSAPHAANLATSGRKRFEPCVDVGFIGAGTHRREGIRSFLLPILSRPVTRMAICPEGPEFGIESRKLPAARLIRNADLIYSSIRVNLSIHSDAQRIYGVSVQESVFTRALSCGFQICDAPLLNKYYSQDETPVFSDPEEYVSKALEFLKEDELRESHRKKAFEKTCAQHTYYNRLKTLFDRLDFPQAQREIQGKIEEAAKKPYPPLIKSPAVFRRALLSNLGRDPLKAILNARKIKPA